MSRQPSSTTGPRVPATVAFVGTGPGDPSLLTLAAVEALRTADVVVTDELTTAALVSTYARPEVTVVDASHGTSGRELTHATRAKLVVQAAKQHPGGQIVRLMDGDPSTFNGVAEEAQACRRAGLSIEIIPGVSAVTAVPAYAGIPLTGPGVANVVVPSSSGPRTDMSAGVSSATSVVLLGGSAELTAQLAGLLRAGREPSSPVALIERGTTTEQHTVITTLEHAADAVAGLGHPSMAIVGPTVALHDKLAWFENKPLFGWKVLLPRTKEQSAPVATALARHGAEAVVGQGDHGAGDWTLRVGRVHLRECREGGAGAVRGGRSRRARFCRAEGRGGRRGYRGGAAVVGDQPRSRAVGREFGPRTPGGLARV